MILLFKAGQEKRGMFQKPNQWNFYVSKRGVKDLIVQPYQCYKIWSRYLY